MELQTFYSHTGEAVGVTASSSLLWTPVVPCWSGSPTLQAHTEFSCRIFLPTCWRSLPSLMTPCRLMRMGCAPAGTSRRAAWWAYWSRRPSSSARSVHPTPWVAPVSLNFCASALRVGFSAQPVSSSS